MTTEHEIPEHMKEYLDKGFKVVSYRKHDGDERYSVKLEKVELTKSFGNVTALHLAETMGTDVEDLKPSHPESEAEAVRPRLSSPAKGSSASGSHKATSGSFQDCVDSGGRITYARPVKGPGDNYSIKIKVKDEEKVFNRVNIQHLEEVDGFDTARDTTEE